MAKPFDPYRFVGGRKARRSDARRNAQRAAQFVDAVHYMGGILSVVLVEEYGWTVEQVKELVGKMNARTRAEINGL